MGERSEKVIPGWLASLRPGAAAEAFKAFLLFGLLLAALAGVAGPLAFRDLSRLVQARRLQIARHEATRIAEGILALGRQFGEGEGLDFYRLRQHRNTLEAWLREYLSGSPLVRDVDVLDRFGARVVYVGRDTPGAYLPGAERAAASRVLERTVRIELRAPKGVLPEGELRVGITTGAVDAELEELKRSLRIKVFGAALIGMGVLAAALVYVLHLIRRNQGLEQERQAANRRAQVALLGSGLAHEIRNPLNAMNLNLQMLEEELQAHPSLEGADVGDLVASIKSEIRRLERLVENFLVYARPTAPRFEEADLNKLLSDLARFFQADFRQSGLRLVVDLEPLLPSVELDTTQIKQALMNLLINARQVLKPGGTVTLRSRAGPAGEVVVEVQDDGPGIPSEVRDKIFDVFYSNRGGGTGLGLPIAQQVVTHHGGTIEVESEQGRGTTFRIRLPRRQARPAPAAPTTHNVS